MAQIKIDDISVTGSDLFSDSESYLDELSNDSEMSNVKGGTWVTVTSLFSTITGPFVPPEPEQIN
jgi:hypothetical protein